MKIEIPKLLLALRSEVTKAKARAGRGRIERLIFRGWAWVMRHPRIYEMAGSMGSLMLPRSDGGGLIRRVLPFMNVGPLAAWLSQRDLPPLAPRSFRQLWRGRVKATSKN